MYVPTSKKFVLFIKLTIHDGNYERVNLTLCNCGKCILLRKQIITN